MSARISPSVRCLTVVACLSLLLCLSTESYGKRQGPDTQVLTRVSDLIALVRVKWIRPADQPGDKKQRLYSRVTVQVTERLKGSDQSKELIIGTSNAEEGDAPCYCAEQWYLAFLVRRGDVYRLTFGPSGLFERNGSKITGWPKPGEPSYPKTARETDYKRVKREISDMLKAGQKKLAPAKGRPVRGPTKTGQG